MTAPTLTRPAHATETEIQQIIAHRREVLCPAVYTLRQVDDPNPVLIVWPVGDDGGECDDLDVTLWARDVFGADDKHRVTWVDKQHGQRVTEWFCAWRGWHVQVIGRQQITVPAHIASGLLLTGVCDQCHVETRRAA